MSKIFITSGKVLQKSVSFAFYNLGDTNGKDGKPAKLTYDHTKEPHPDLTAAFSKMAVHVALMSESVTKKSIKNVDDPPESISLFHATGFHLKGNHEAIDAYKLHGYKILSTGKACGLDCPYERNLEAGEQDAYLFIEHLGAAVEVCQAELELYMGGKYAPEIKQGELELE